MSELDSAKVRRLERLVFMARCVLAWERLWPRLWPFLILSAILLIAILFDLFSALSAALHLMVLGLSGLGLLGALALAFRNLDFPTRHAGLHRLEKDSGLANQPLFALIDSPLGGEKNKTALAIWIHHQDRMAAALTQVRLGWPQSYLWKRDPYSLRAVLILLLVLGVIEARFDFKDRLVRAFTPKDQIVFAQSWQLQAWITPPSYTGLETRYIKVDATASNPESSLVIAQNSKLLVRLEGRPNRDTHHLNIGPFRETFKNLGRGVFTLETVLEQGNRLTVKRRDETLIDWPVQILADNPPIIRLGKRVEAGFRGHLGIDFVSEDDYGLKEASLEIRALTSSNIPEITLSQPIDGVSAKGRFQHNLSEHPWAGTDVIVTPKVLDNAAQSAFGPALRLTLPQRHFSHPLAQRLIQIRKNLYDEGADQKVYARLSVDRILDRPADFDHAVAVYLALRVASDRLAPDMAAEVLSGVQSILWQTAVRLDEGASGTTRNQLEDLARQMQELMNGTEQKGAMEALFEQMQQSLQKYMQEMAKANQSVEDLQDALGPGNADMMSSDEMMKLLERARDLMRAGNIKAAQALMKQFQSILSRLAMQKPIDPKQAKAAQEMMKELRQIQQDQQSLMDRTFKRSRNQDRPSIASTKKAIEEAEEQKQLRARLQAQLDKLNQMKTKMPDVLREALRSMERAGQSLERGLDEDALQAQMRAVDQLEDGIEESATALAQKMGRQPAPKRTPLYDPMGRGVGGRLDGGSGQMVPSEAEMHRSRQILQELYRRAGQKGRTEQELNYIERLLERF